MENQLSSETTESEHLALQILRIWHFSLSVENTRYFDAKLYMGACARQVLRSFPNIPLTDPSPRYFNAVSTDVFQLPLATPSKPYKILSGSNTKKKEKHYLVDRYFRQVQQ